MFAGVTQEHGSSDRCEVAFEIPFIFLQTAQAHGPKPFALGSSLSKLFRGFVFRREDLPGKSPGQAVPT